MLEGWRGLVDGLFATSGRARSPGSCRAAGRSSARAARTRSSSTAASRRCCSNFADRELDALVAIGGEDTLGVAARLYAEHGLPVVGVPKTIDNDLSGTDYTFGFDTAVTIATEAIDRLHTTAESHNRVMVVEVMGRHAGWIAVHERHRGRRRRHPHPRAARRLDEVAETIRKRHARGKNFSIVVVSEGASCRGVEPTRRRNRPVRARDALERGVGETLGHEIEQRTGFETRVTVLGHVQRGGTPTARDRVLATRFGLKAADLAQAGEFGQMAALRGDDDRLGAARGGDRRAQDRAARVVRGRAGVLRLDARLSRRRSSDCRRSGRAGRRARRVLAGVARVRPRRGSAARRRRGGGRRRFEAAGARIARAPGGPVVLLAGLLLLDALVTVLLNLDTAVVFMTPVLLHAARRRLLGRDRFSTERCSWRTRRRSSSPGRTSPI